MRLNDWPRAFAAILPALLYFGAIEFAIAYAVAHAVSSALSDLLTGLGAAGCVASLAIAYRTRPALIAPLIALLVCFGIGLTGTLSGHRSIGWFALDFFEFALELTIFRAIAEGATPKWA